MRKLFLLLTLMFAITSVKAVAEEQGFIFVIDGGQMLYTDEKKCTNILPLVKTKLGIK